MSSVPEPVPQPPGPDRLQSWVARVRAELELPTVDVTALLDLARDVAHGVARPAAPVTCFLVGLHAGRAIAAGADPVGAVADASALVAALLPPPP
jgi:hypothetical protein